MIGSRMGSVLGSLLTSRVGSSLDEDGPNGTYTGNRDVTKGWARPQNAAAWTSLLSGLGLSNPDFSNDCTLASGNMTDQMGGGLVLTQSVTPNYAVAATGWAGTGVDMTDATSDGFRAGAGVGPNPNTTSQVWLVVCSIEVEPVASRQFFGVAGSSVAALFSPSAGTNRLQIGVAGVSTNGAVDHVTGSYVMALRYDRAASAAKLSSDLETVVGTYSAATADGNKGLGYGTTSPGSITTMLIAMWQGANAEALGDAGIASIRSRIKSPP